MTKVYDIAVVGGGLYGCKTALTLAQAGLHVALIEQSDQLSRRASRNNQSRIHNGYHYPRSLMTALGSQKNYEKFQQEFSDCVIDDFDHIYAISKENSKISAHQFENFCKTVNIPLNTISDKQRKQFDFNRIENAFLVSEAGINTDKMAQSIQKNVEKEENINVIFNTFCLSAQNEEKHISIKTQHGKNILAKGLIITTYADINRFLIQSNLTPLALKLELTEMPLIQRPPELADIGLTVMDGPFFSVMPFGGDGLCTLSHVRYTPHASAMAGDVNPYEALEKYKQNTLSRFPFMRNDAARYVPTLRQATYIDTLFEVKAIPLKNELDDGRPILMREHVGKLGGDEPFIVSLLGSKLDTVYEWEAILKETYNTSTQPKAASHTKQPSDQSSARTYRVA